MQLLQPLKAVGWRGLRPDDFEVGTAPPPTAAPAGYGPPHRLTTRQFQISVPSYAHITTLQSQSSSESRPKLDRSRCVDANRGQTPSSSGHMAPPHSSAAPYIPQKACEQGEAGCDCRANGGGARRCVTLPSRLKAVRVRCRTIGNQGLIRKLRDPIP